MEKVLPELYREITKCYILGEEFGGCRPINFANSFDFMNNNL